MKPPAIQNPWAARVYRALKQGAHTQRAIREATSLSPDRIGEGLAHLRFVVRPPLVRFTTDGQTRGYFPIFPIYLSARRDGMNDAPLSFSTLCGLMCRSTSYRETDK